MADNRSRQLESELIAEFFRHSLALLQARAAAWTTS